MDQLIIILMKILNLNYNFAIDNNLKNLNIIILDCKFKLNNFVTKFNFIEENGEMGNTNILKKKQHYNFDENNSFF